MDVEEIWKLFQTHMEYTDEEMELFKSDHLSETRTMVTKTNRPSPLPTIIHSSYPTAKCSKS
jgi:hypothetical protein